MKTSFAIALGSAADATDGICVGQIEQGQWVTPAVNVAGAAGGAGAVAALPLRSPEATR